jgi:hypothetical protein
MWAAQRNNAGFQPAVCSVGSVTACADDDAVGE